MIEINMVLIYGIYSNKQNFALQVFIKTISGCRFFSIFIHK